MDPNLPALNEPGEKSSLSTSTELKNKNLATIKAAAACMHAAEAIALNWSM